MLNIEKIIKLARETIYLEMQAISDLCHRIDIEFVKACECLLSCSGRIIVTGMGKSSHIASKVAATFASTGTPAFFVHPAEASHGDIGVMVEKDVILAISNSGNTPEIVALLPVIKRRKIPLITITGNNNSILAREAAINLDVSVAKEACPIGLAPTSSTTVALVMGDALAVTLISERGFTAQDFALSHPGGILGKRLLLRVDDLMHSGDAIPKVTEQTLLFEALLEMTQKKLGMIVVLAHDNKIKGIFTDGDLRRALEKQINIHKSKISEVMTKNCKTITYGTLAFDALRIMEKYAITSLLITDQCERLLGVIHIHDILKSGLV